jgi:peptidoglycan DL-endopeptidase CwlO
MRKLLTALLMTSGVLAPVAISVPAMASTSCLENCPKGLPAPPVKPPVKLPVKPPVVVKPPVTPPAVTPPATVQPSLPPVTSCNCSRIYAYYYAIRWINVPYAEDGDSPNGFDCSGLVSTAYRAAGIRLPRDTYEMLGSGMLIPVSEGQARPGDLVFFGSGHVNLYAGPGLVYGEFGPGDHAKFMRTTYYHPTAFYRVKDAG